MKIIIFIMLFWANTIFAQNALLVDEINTINIVDKYSPAVIFVHDGNKKNASGILWDHQGHIVTNYHVVHEAEDIFIRLSNENDFKVKIIGSDKNNDIAVLKIINNQSLNYIKDIELIPLTTQSKLKVGQKVIVIGNPYGLSNTVSTGIISSLNRIIPGFIKFSIRNIIQIDASINPGNSGGPLINSNGELIGINLAIYTKSGDFTGIGFAIPATEVVDIVKQIINKGYVSQIGFGLYLINDEILTDLKLIGAGIYKIAADSPAKNSGLKEAEMSDDNKLLKIDLITAVNGKKINNSDDLFHMMKIIDINDIVELTIKREDEELKFKIKAIDISNL